MLDNLKPLLASYALISANQSSNAILVTDTQTRVRRIASVIQALDTSISSVTEIRVFPLQNADAEEVAKLVTDVFETPGEQRQTRNDPRERMRQFFTRMRGRGDNGPGGGDDSDSNDGRVASTTVKAVADAHSNAVVVNAPNDLMDDIEALIRQIDVAAEELLQFRVFTCRYADAERVAESVTALFKSDSASRTADQGSRRFGRFGMMRGGPTGGASQNGSTSERRLEEADVRAAADLRTNSVMVTASAKTMVMIEQMIRELDTSPKNVPQVYVYRVQHADLEALQQTLQNMFDDIEDNSSGSSSTTRSTTAPTASTRTGTRSASTGTRSTGTSSGTRR
jgi:type II secretory pathway component GspD/PulD (secretin)